MEEAMMLLMTYASSSYTKLFHEFGYGNILEIGVETLKHRLEYPVEEP